MKNTLKKILIIISSFVVIFSSAACSITIKGISQPDEIPFLSSETNQPDSPETPVAETEKETSVTETKKETPVTETKKETPVVETEKENPVIETEKETPVTETKKETSVTETKKETPVKPENTEKEPESSYRQSVIPRMKTRILLSQLNDDELSFVETVYQGAMDFKKSISVPSSLEFTFDQASRLISAMFDDCPELMMCEGSYELIGYNSTRRIRLEYSLDENTYANQLSEIVNVLEHYKEKTSGMNAYEKELYVHDDILRNTTFVVSPQYIETAYGSLVDGHAICQGYAKGFQWAMQYLGIPCMFVTSESMNHGWNLVKINNNFYQIDLTWDDDNDINSYAYFNLSDNQMSMINHSYDHLSGWSYPSSDSINDNYYVKNGLYIKSGDDIKARLFKELDRIFESGGGIVKLMFENPEDLSLLVRVQKSYIEEWNKSYNVNISYSRWQFENTSLVYYTEFSFK